VPTRTALEGDDVRLRSALDRIAQITNRGHLVRWLLPFAMILLAGSSSSASKPSVVFDGDSITVLATPAIHQLLGPGYDVDVLAKDGIRIDQSLPALESALRSHPSAVVVNLGTNDALHGGADPGWESSWDKLIRITRNTPCVVLTTIDPTADSLTGRPVATGINADIMALASRDPGKYKVADWSGFLSRHARSQGTYLRPEWILIHPTPAGDVELATLDQDALATCGSRIS
jgi:GDSL-like Lipase/Acylhydrolase family